MEAIKEPRGFIKFLQIVLAICAFATAVGPHMSSSFRILCPGSAEQTLTLYFQYPYSLYQATFETPLCTTSNINGTASVGFSGDCHSASEFYVFVGVTAFLYSLTAVIFYVICDEKYKSLGFIPKADFVVTIVYVLFWLISSSVFADALGTIKRETRPSRLWENTNNNFPECQTPLQYNVTCSSNDDGDYATLNVSIIFGFLNMVVWGGNLWFLYKETNWFPESPEQPSQPPSTSASEIQPRI